MGAAVGYKVSIGSNIMEGPWGGGNQFAISLSRYLEKRGWEVVSGLRDGDIDVIVLTEPRITSETGAYNQKHISRYLVKKPDTIVVHRINECDERKGTTGVNKYLTRANKVADYTVFISEFLRDLFIEKGFFKENNSSVIKNGADKEVFNRKGLMKWDGKSPIRIVTHHWGYNYKKGFDVYKKLDALSSIKGLKIQFNYIGRIPKDARFDGMNVTPPLSGNKLAAELKKNHIYITGSVNEPAGMHHIEGAMCGLPLLFRNSGALPEYCNGFGVMFEGAGDVEDKLGDLIKSYDYYFNKMETYPYNSELMCRDYEDVFLALLGDRDTADRSRRRLKYMAVFIKELFYQSIEIILLKLKNLIRKVKGLDGR
jgi:glycosyltransferase involved in cell wall biosynthesis